jgi:hypothetical protein
MRKICITLSGAEQCDDESAKIGNFATAKLLPIVPHPRLAKFDEYITNSRRFHILFIDLRAAEGKLEKFMHY